MSKPNLLSGKVRESLAAIVPHISDIEMLKAKSFDCLMYKIETYERQGWVNLSGVLQPACGWICIMVLPRIEPFKGSFLDHVLNLIEQEVSYEPAN